MAAAMEKAVSDTVELHEEIARLRSDKELLEAGVREMANMIDDLRARNAELVAALQDAIKMIEVVCAPIATAHLRAALAKAEAE